MADETKDDAVVNAPSSPELGYAIPTGIYAAENSPLVTGTSTENQKVAEAQGEADKPAPKSSTARTPKS